MCLVIVSFFEIMLVSVYRLMGGGMVSVEVKRGISFPRAGVVGSRCWEQDSGPLQQQDTRLTPVARELHVFFDKQTRPLPFIRATVLVL